jgi:hypothetical protein
VQKLFSLLKASGKEINGAKTQADCCADYKNRGGNVQQGGNFADFRKRDPLVVKTDT